MGSGERVRLVRRVACAREDVVRTDVEELCVPLACESREDLRTRCVDLAAERGLVLCLVHGGVRSRMEDGVGRNRLKDGTHDVLVRQREDLRGDSVYLVTACRALLYTVVSQLSRCTCDENFHSNPPFVSFFLLYHKTVVTRNHFFSRNNRCLLLYRRDCECDRCALVQFTPERDLDVVPLGDPTGNRESEPRAARLLGA